MQLISKKYNFYTSALLVTLMVISSCKRNDDSNASSNKSSDSWSEVIEIDEMTKERNSFLSVRKLAQNGTTVELKVECETDESYKLIVSTFDGNLVIKGIDPAFVLLGARIPYSAGRITFGSKSVNDIRVLQSTEFANEYVAFAKIDLNLKDNKLDQVQVLELLEGGAMPLNFALELVLDDGAKIVFRGNQFFDDYIKNNCIPLQISGVKSKLTQAPNTMPEQENDSGNHGGEDFSKMIKRRRVDHNLEENIQNLDHVVEKDVTGEAVGSELVVE